MRVARPLRQLYVQVVLGMLLGMALGHFWPQAGALLKPVSDGIRRPREDDDCADRLLHDRLGDHVARERKGNRTHDLAGAGTFLFPDGRGARARARHGFLMRPGAGMHIDAHISIRAILAQYVKQAHPDGLVAFALNVIPETMLGAFEKGEVLPVLLLSLLFGFALNAHPRAGRPVLALIDGIAQALFRILAMIMRLAPLGAFGAMAFTVGRFGIRSVGSLGMLMVSFYVACVLFVALVLAPLARLHGFALWRLLRYLREELLIVLATSSTEPVLPRLIVKLEALGCDKGVVGLVLPAGYSFNLDGTAIYLTLASVFIAQACDVPLSASQIATMLARHAANLQGRGGRVRERAGGARRDADGDSGSARRRAWRCWWASTASCRRRGH